MTDCLCQRNFLFSNVEPVIFFEIFKSASVGKIITGVKEVTRVTTRKHLESIFQRHNIYHSILQCMRASIEGKNTEASFLPVYGVHFFCKSGGLSLAF